MTEASISISTKNGSSQTCDDIFISYSRRDLVFAKNLVEKLTNASLKVWFDQNNIPEAVNFRTEIERGIINAHNFIFIISSDSIGSRYCREEIEIALKYGKRIIPILCRMPNANEIKDSMHPVVQDLNWIYLKESEGALNVLCQSISSALNKHKAYV